MERRVIFAASGGGQTGLGHVRRCLSLAGSLRAHGVASRFVLDGEAAVARWVAAAGFQTTAGNTPQSLVGAVSRAAREWAAQAVVVDSYAVPTDGLRALRATVAPLVMIDDLADRALPADLVVNGGAGAESLHYRGLAATRYLLGPAYALLRPEFAVAPRREIPAATRRVLLTMGGGDTRGLLARLVAWTRAALPDADVDVIVSPLVDAAPPEGEASPGRGQVALHRDPADVRALMLCADLALCAGGQTAYELAATGTPAVAIQVAANQAGNLGSLAEAGALLWVGEASEPGLEAKVGRTMAALGADAAQRARLSRAGRALVDGRGAERVAGAVLELMGTVQPCQR
jgi:UDP-2,4-diacetamido-2,4,6-trideoxy-beta-L-altropyranose hydrolase